MKKKLLFVYGGLTVILIIAGILLSLHNSNKNKKMEELIQEESEQEEVMVSLRQAREDLSSLMESGRNGEYRNLKFDEFSPFITEEDTICQLTISPLEVEFSTEQIQKQLDVIQAFYDYKVDEAQITVNSFDGISVGELRQELEKENSEYLQNGYWLIYRNGEEYAQVNNSLTCLWIDMGLEGVVPSGEDCLDKVYYAGAADGSLDDTYETATGSISVGDAISQVENYFNYNFPISLLDKMEYKVSKVFIVKNPDGTFAFDFLMRRSYKGVLFESALSGTCAYDSKESVDLMEAVLSGENHVLFFNGFECNKTVEETQVISRVISPKKAVEYISRKIGDNTVYTVTGIELSYMCEIIDEENGIYTETPAWLFITTNETSGKETRIYVNVVTGEIRTRVM